MAKFTDGEGRDWQIRVDVTAIKQVRNDLEINLGDIGEAPDYLVKLTDDPVLLCDMLYVLCEEQAKDRKVTDADFGRLLIGDVIDHATMALEEAITDFFPQQKRSLLQRLRKKVEKVRTMGEELVKAKLDDPKLEKQLAERMKAEMDEAIKKSLMPLPTVTGSPESSEASTPAP